MADTIYDVLVEILDETFHVEPEMTHTEVTLADMAFDSLDVAELAAIVQDRFGVKVTGRDVGKGTTLREVVAVIHAGLDAQRTSATTASSSR